VGKALVWTLWTTEKLLHRTGIRIPDRRIREKLNTTNFHVFVFIQGDKNLCAPDDHSTINTQKYFKQFQSQTTGWPSEKSRFETRQRPYICLFS
jgi:hypothetical protein